MIKAKTPSQTLIMQMREEGRSKDDAGVFEVNLAEGKIVWANDYALDHAGYTLDQIKHMTLLDVIPEAFHGSVQEAMMEASKNKLGIEEASTSVWPMKTSGGKILWWAVVNSVMEFPLIWTYGDHIQTTGPTGMSFLFMQAFMRAANGRTGLYGQVAELRAWTESQISRLDEADNNLKKELSALESKMNEVLAASQDAAKTTKTTHEKMEVLHKAFQDFEAKYGVEILKLIGTDTIHDKRINAFEQHVKMTTDLAVKSIEMQAQKSTQGFMVQAQESSKGLSKKVIIPVSLIATIATIIQVLVERCSSGH